MTYSTSFFKDDHAMKVFEIHMNFHSKELHTVKTLKIVRQPKSAAYYIRRSKKNNTLLSKRM